MFHLNSAFGLYGGGMGVGGSHYRVAAEAGVTPAQLALAFCRSRWFVPSTLVGATSLPQLAENVLAFTDACAAAVTDDVLSELVRCPPPLSSIPPALASIPTYPLTVSVGTTLTRRSPLMHDCRIASTGSVATPGWRTDRAM